MGYIITIETLWDERDVYLVDNKLRLQIQLDILGDLVRFVIVNNNIKFKSSEFRRALVDFFHAIFSRFITPGNGGLVRSSGSANANANKRKRSSESSDSSTSDTTTDNEDPGCTILKRDMRKLLKSQHDTDFTIECGHKLFPVHQIILSGKNIFVA